MSRQDPLLREGYRRCAELTWRYGTTYYWGAALLPRSNRSRGGVNPPAAGELQRPGPSESTSRGITSSGEPRPPHQCRRLTLT